MAGIDKRNEKRKASSLLSPDISPATIVIPDLEIPGITANPWAIPTTKPSIRRTLPRPIFTKLLNNNRKPVKTNPQPTINEFNIAASAKSFTEIPITAVIAVPDKTAHPVDQPADFLASLLVKPFIHCKSRDTISGKKKTIVDGCAGGVSGYAALTTTYVGGGGRWGCASKNPRTPCGAGGGWVC